MESKLLNLKLKRVIEVEDGTFGVLLVNNIPRFCTVEPNWRNNGPNSCIPTGLYSCKKYSSTKYPDTVEIIVPGRSAILFHGGNIEDHSLGCIILGKSFGNLKSKTSVVDSAKAVSEFKALIKPYDFFRLSVESFTNTTIA